MNSSNYPDWSSKMSTPKIKAVTPPEGKRLLVTFVNGVQKVYDCQGILQLDRFQLLRNEAFFQGGYR